MPSKVKSKKRSFIGKLFRIIWKTALYLFLFSVAIVLVYRFINPPITSLMILKAFEKKKDGSIYGITKDWVPLREISPYLVQAVIASEDNRFLTHHGFDLEAIEKARENNRKDRRVKGASTISMQTAKNVFLWPQRNFIRKGLEAYFTLWIELIWGKKRIMEVYLNVMETGPGIYGAEAASQHYFGKPAARLDRHQAALIAAVLPNPVRWNPARPTSYIRERQQWILWNMNNIGPVNLGQPKEEKKSGK